MDDKIFRFTVISNGQPDPMPFSVIAHAFFNYKDSKTGIRYFDRWNHNGEALDLVLDDFLRDKAGVRIDTAANFHQLLEALILFLEGGDYGHILQGDAEESFAKYKNELDEVQLDRTVVFGAGQPILDPLVGGYGSGESAPVSCLVFWEPRPIESDMNISDLVRMKTDQGQSPADL